MARAILSLGILADLALSTAKRKAGFIAGSGPPALPPYRFPLKLFGKFSHVWHLAHFTPLNVAPFAVS